MKRVLAIIAVSLVFAATPAFAQDDSPGENLGGYDGMASAFALSFQPFLPALISTGDVPFEASLALSTARVKSGGNALGRGALVWPGSAASDPGPILGVAFGQPEVGSLIPKWPLQAEANQNSGTVDTGAPPIAGMRALGESDRAEGHARVTEIDVSRVVKIEKVSSSSGSLVQDSTIAANGRVVLHGITLFGGHITIEEIRSASRTASLGSSASASGDIDVIGLKVGGVNVSVTDDGFHVEGLPPDAKSIPGAGDGPFPGASPEQIVNAVLENLGARLTLMATTSEVSGGVAKRVQPGLIVSVDNPVGGQGPIPPGRFDVILGASSSQSTATPPFAVGAPEVPVDEPVDTETGGVPETQSLGDGPSVAGDTVEGIDEVLTQPATGNLGEIGEGLPGVQNTDYKFNGVPMGMMVVLLGGALLAARYIRRFFDSMMRGGA